MGLAASHLEVLTTPTAIAKLHVTPFARRLNGWCVCERTIDQQLRDGRAGRKVGGSMSIQQQRHWLALRDRQSGCQAR